MLGHLPLCRFGIRLRLSTSDPGPAGERNSGMEYMIMTFGVASSLAARSGERVEGVISSSSRQRDGQLYGLFDLYRAPDCQGRGAG